MYIGRKYYFLVIAETQNLTKAAQILHVSQPSLTQYVNRLEQDLGVRLLNRNHTPLLLTEAGKLYLNYIKGSLDLEQQFRTQLEHYRQKENCRLSIGVPTQLIPMVFGSIIHEFIQKAPQTILSLKDGTSLTVLDQITEGTVNIAIFHTEKKTDSRFVRHLLQTERLLLICNRNSPLAAGRVGTREKPLFLTEKDLPLFKFMVFVTFSPQYYINKFMDAYFEKINDPSLSVMELPNMRTAFDYILAPKSNGIAVLSDFVFQSASLNDVTFFKLKGYSPKWYLTANYRTQEILSDTESLFWDTAIRKTVFPDV